MQPVYPTYSTGPQPNGSWVVSSGQIINPAGIQVDLGNRVRAKAIALNPNRRTHTAAVLTLGAAEAVEVFDTYTGVVLQDYITLGTDSSGSYSGIAYSADGKHLVFSQDSSNVTIANVTAEGLLEDNAQISVPPNNSFITCFPNSPPGAYDRTLRHVLYSKHFLSRRRGDFTGWQERLRPAEPERYAHPDRPDREAAEQGDADPRRQRAAQHRDQQQRHHRLRQQRGWPGGYSSRTSKSTPPALRSSPIRWLALRLPVPFLWSICPQ